MFQTLYRQRRRILVCATLFTLTAMIGAMTDGRALAHVPFWAPPVATLLFFAVCAAGIAGVILAVPQLRRLCEVVALFTLIETVFIWIQPDANAALSNPVLRLAIAATVTALLYLIFYGRLLDQVPALFAFGARHKTLISAPPQQVWRAIAPSAVASAEDSATDAPEPPPHRPYLWDHAPEAVTVILLERPWRCRFAVKPEVPGPGRAAGIFDIRLRPDPRGALLEIGLYQTGIPLGEVLRLWLDDELGREADRLRVELEAQRGMAIPPAPLGGVRPA